MAEQDQPALSQPPPLPASLTRASRKTRTGEVISSGMNKTIVVRTVTRVPHPKFGKIVKQMKKFYAHDEENKAKTWRHGAHHGNASAEQAQALAFAGSASKVTPK